MKTFTIYTGGTITVFATKKEAAATTTPFDPFTSQSELAEVAAEWPANRLVEIWNGIPGVNAVTKFTNRKIAIERIWKAIQNLGSVEPKPPTEAAQPVVTDVQPEPAVVEVQPEKEILVDAAREQVATEQPSTEGEPTAAETVADAGAQVPEIAPVAVGPASKPTRAKKAPKKAAPPEASGPRWPRSWRRWAGRNTPSAALWPAR
jgi:hypothetical protein